MMKAPENKTIVRMLATHRLDASPFHAVVVSRLLSSFPVVKSPKQIGPTFQDHTKVQPVDLIKEGGGVPHKQIM